VFLFSSLAIRAVGRTAQTVMKRFAAVRSIPASEGHLIQYGTCVDVVAKSA
jgi:Na+/H+-translocating membrane pyrophosphatase